MNFFRKGIAPALLLFLAGAAARDTYQRQPLDVEHYHFALTLADSTDRIAGEATVRMRLLAAGMYARGARPRRCEPRQAWDAGCG